MSNPASTSPPGASPAATATPVPSPPAGRPGLSGGAKVAIVVGVVVLVLVAALVAGFIPGVSLFSKSGGGSTPAISSTGALSEAGTLATAHDAGSLVLVAGVSTTYSFQGGKEAGNASCPVHDALASNFTVPAQTGSYSSGDATLWVFVYVNTVGDNESMIAVAGTNTYFLGTVSGSSCVSLSSLETLPGTFVNSTSVAAAVDADAGPFLAVHAQANAVYALVEYGTGGPEWVVAYTNCSYDPATSTVTGGPKGDLFFAMANGTSGVVTNPVDLLGGANCSSLSNLSSVLPVYDLLMAPFTSSSNVNGYFDFLALAPSAGLTTKMFGLEVRNAASVIQPVAAVPVGCAYGASLTSCSNGSGWYVVLLNSTDAVVATYGATGWGDLAPATTNLTLSATLEMVVVSSVAYAGQGYTLTAFATGPAIVTGSTSL